MNTILINYRHMKIGGIENYIYYMLKEVLKTPTRIIWLCDKNYILAEEYNDVLLNNKIEKYAFDTHGFKWCKIPKGLKFQKNEEVKILSFWFMDYVRMDSFTKHYKGVHFDNFYVVPHFAGVVNFPDEDNIALFNKALHRNTKSLFNKMVKNNELKCFSEKHILTIEKKYDLIVPNHEDCNIKDAEPFVEYNEELIVQKAKRDSFNILSVGRLEFPHKAFVLGLIDVFVKIYQIDSRANLTIIGYGPDENKLIEKINSVDSKIREKINFIGKKSPEELEKEYNKAHVNISVAGCASKGAKMGVVTLPCRHYCEDCEVYGFYDGCVDKVLSSEKGEDPIPYIKHLLNCSNEEYINISRRGYECVKNKYRYDPLCFLKYSSKIVDKITIKEKLFFMYYNAVSKIKYLLHQNK